MAAVEELLYERRSADLSLREITAAAGANVAAVNYHFGSKGALIAIVVERLLRANAEAQGAALDRLLESGAKPDVAAVVRTWFAPVLWATPDGRPPPAQVIAPIVRDGSRELNELAAEIHAGTRTRVFDLLAGLLPELAPKELAFRMAFAAHTMGALIAGAFDVWADALEAMDPQGAPSPDYDEQALAFVVGALVAPPTEPGR